MPDQNQDQRHPGLDARWQGPGQRQHAQGPQQQGIGIMALQVIDLPHQENAGTHQHAADGEQSLGQQTIAFQQQQAATVGQQQRQENHGQFPESPHGFPVVGEQQDHAEADQDRAGRRDQVAPEAALAQLVEAIAARQGLGLGRVDQPFLLPQGKLLTQPVPPAIGHQDPPRASSPASSSRAWSSCSRGT